MVKPLRRRQRGVPAEDMVQDYDAERSAVSPDDRLPNTDPPNTDYPRRGRHRGAMPKDDIQRLFKRMVEDARSYVDNDLSPVREKCWRYYNGGVDAPAKKGRSKAVDRVVRDTVDGILPQLMKVFTSNVTVARYIDPMNPEMGEQATRYAHHVFTKENQGFKLIYDHFKDGLVGGLGSLRNYCEHQVETTEERYEGLSEDEFALLMSDQTEDIDVLDLERITVAGPAPAPTAPFGAVPSPSSPAGPAPMSPGAPPPQPLPGAAMGAPGGAMPGQGSPPGMPAGPPPMPGMPPPGGSLPPGPPGAPGAMPAAPASSAPTPGGNVIPFKFGGNTIVNATLRRTHRKKKQVIDGIDPGDFIIDRRATCEDDARLIGMDTVRPVSDAIGMGLPRDVVIDTPTAPSEDRTGEKSARNPRGTYDATTDEVDDESADREIRIVDVIVRIDEDGDGVAERRHIVALGPECDIVVDEPIDEVPYCLGSPILVPHSAVGQGIAETVLDLQDIQTAILRQQLDSLYQAVNPRTIAVENQVTLADLVDNQFNGVIRCRAPGMVQPFNVEFVGAQAFPMVERIDKIKQNRTGLSEASQGLDADALQSSTEIGVRAVIGAALQKIELLARVYAETSLKRLFRSILALAVRYQQEPLTITVDDQPFTVDPRSWKADMEVEVEVGLGNGNDEERKQALLFVLGKQEQALLQLGPANPLCDLGNYQNALSDFMKLTPYKDTERYFKKPDPQAIAQMQAQMGQQDQQQPDPSKMAKVQADAQAKMAKLQADMQINQQKLALAKQQGDQKTMLEAQKAQTKLELERMKLMGKMQADQQRLEVETQTDVVELQAETALEKYKVDEKVKADTRLKSQTRQGGK